MLSPDRQIPTYIINLLERTDRMKSSIREFHGKHEFDFEFIATERDSNAAVGLWKNILHAIKQAKVSEKEYVLVCEDDHIFTSCYSKERLFNSIDTAIRLETDVLLGGVSWSESAVEICDSLYWIEHFSGTQFMIIFSRFFDRLLSAEFLETDNADSKISNLTEAKYVIHPFISIQKDFGYSDITKRNDKKGVVKSLFQRSSQSIENLRKAKYFYSNQIFSEYSTPKNFCLSTYILLQGSKEDYGLEQRDEFEVTIIENNNTEEDKWNSLKRIVKEAISIDEDLVVICQSDYLLTERYSVDFLAKSIIKAHLLGTEILLGNLRFFSHAVPISRNMFWIDKFLGSNFIILYKSLFKTILKSNYNSALSFEDILSNLSSNKIVLYPFISNSDKEYQQPDGLINHSMLRLKKINSKKKLF